MKEAYRLQEAVGVERADIGKFEVADWNKEEVEQMRETINVVAKKDKDGSITIYFGGTPRRKTSCRSSRAGTTS